MMIEYCIYISKIYLKKHVFERSTVPSFSFSLVVLVHPLHRNFPQQQQRTTKDRDDVRCHALVLRAKGDKGTLVKGTLNGLIETKKVELQSY